MKLSQWAEVGRRMVARQLSKFHPRVFRYGPTLRSAAVLLLWATVGFVIPAARGVVHSEGFRGLVPHILWATALLSPLLYIAAQDLTWSSSGAVVCGESSIRYRPPYGRGWAVDWVDVESFVVEGPPSGAGCRWAMVIAADGRRHKLRGTGLGRRRAFVCAVIEQAGLGEPQLARFRHKGGKRSIVTLYAREDDDVADGDAQ